MPVVHEAQLVDVEELPEVVGQVHQHVVVQVHFLHLLQCLLAGSGTDHPVQEFNPVNIQPSSTPECPRTR